MNRSILFIVLILSLAACKQSEQKKPTDLVIAYNVLSTFPHDVNAFTQGLTVYNGRLFESTGREGTSWIAEVDIATGRQDKKVELDQKYFGEGIVCFGDKVYQLTWQNRVGFVYDAKTFKKLREFRNHREGWGITTDNKHLILSDGTSRLYKLDTATLAGIDSVVVKDSSGEVDNLNELEYVDGFVYANRWGTALIYKIDPATGLVKGILDLTSLVDQVRQKSPASDVLNGIAYEPSTQTWLITGKLWPALFVLRLTQPGTVAKK
ncbi:MAG TPA: glutaminyl-peptide cyclotransferase [Cyclobacteriaceae bacterium]|nr:glutaminyl-peptide cyclotransferase [Cyclobacteriaceae bacterium]